MFQRDKLMEVMSTRFQHLQVDGDLSEPANALEMAIDQHWYVYRWRCRWGWRLT